MHKYIIMGVQGCGKGTQARLLKEAFDLVPTSLSRYGLEVLGVTAMVLLGGIAAYPIE